jgi:hypothetical protein
MTHRSGYCVERRLQYRSSTELPQRAMSALKSRRKSRLEEKKLEAAPLQHVRVLVFASGHRTPINAQDIVNRHNKPLLEQAGLPLIRFQNLRHSYLSLLPQRSRTSQLLIKFSICPSIVSPPAGRRRKTVGTSATPGGSGSASDHRAKPASPTRCLSAPRLARAGKYRRTP